MQIRIFTIPLFDNTELTEEMNAFLRGHKVLTLDRQQITLGEQAFWTFCVSYLPSQTNSSMGQTQQKQAKPDYKEILDEETFAKFSQLRLIRKQLAEKDAVPAYAVFTDSELAEIARLKEFEPDKLKTIQGIGQKKVEKYGYALCEKYKEQTK
ncbi:MAG: HRDC domain-containing protein [Bacteroidales bacterium]|nr:HRDC domain-containing protein [Bacteroidales bacterium]